MVPTVTFNVLYVFFVLSLERRRILHVNVTAHPYAAWAAQQIVEAVDPDAHVVRLIRDRDAIYGAVFDARVRNLGIEQLRTSPRSCGGEIVVSRFLRRKQARGGPAAGGERVVPRREGAAYKCSPTFADGGHSPSPPPSPVSPTSSRRGSIRGACMADWRGLGEGESTKSRRNTEKTNGFANLKKPRSTESNLFLVLRFPPRPLVVQPHHLASPPA
jgi:hypothetical protein